MRDIDRDREIHTAIKTERKKVKERRRNKERGERKRER